ncbi:hypothetical protein RhiJN_23024 [Ceratobasidium sp. AG-Ba]|nr:hypothetical protein RhiJN_23024 [Ceratobasidium sp. AG-Ba]
MSGLRYIFVITVEDMYENGIAFNIDTRKWGLVSLARQTARRIMELLPPIGYVRLYDAYIDNQACYVFMIGARKTPLEDVSTIMIRQFTELFEREPEKFVQGDERKTWCCGTRKLVLDDCILYVSLVFAILAYY